MIGLDIEQPTRFKKWNEQQLKRVFASEEIEYANKFKDWQMHICGFYCVKEALVKALNNTGINFANIVVLHTPENKPYIKQNAYVKKLIKQYNVKEIEISISHTKNYACAVVVAN